MLEPHEERLTRVGPAPAQVQVWIQGEVRPGGPSETLGNHKGATSNTNSQGGMSWAVPEKAFQPSGCSSVGSASMYSKDRGRGSTGPWLAL